MDFEFIKFWKSKDKKEKTMNSIAIWWDKKGENDISSVKVHLDINIWHTKKSDDNYLEFGLKIKDYKKLSGLNIYIPFDINEDDIEDKVELLVSNNEITDAMFNEKVTVSNIDNGSFSSVEFSKTEKNFLYCKLNDDLKFDDNNKKIINIKINDSVSANQSEINTIYYRFRIKKLKKIFTEINENYMWLDGMFKKTGFLEFNLNSSRKLPDAIVDKLTEIRFDSLNLFIMTDNFTNFLFQSEEVKRSRILENHIWKKYLSEENSKNISKIIAYHWKNKKDNFSDYSLFVKISYISKHWYSWIFMILIIIGLGAIGGVVGNWATSKYFHGFNDVNITKKVTEDEIVKHNKGDKNGTE